MTRLLRLSVVLLLAALVYRTQVRMDDLRRRLPPGYGVLYLPSGKYLEYASLGYSTVLADILYLWSIQYTTDVNTPDRFDKVEHMYRVITDLDPRYPDPYQVGAMTMVYEMNNLPMAFRLLDRGIERIPDNWSIPMDAGFYAYMQGGDYDRAIRYFDTALARPGAPSLLLRLRADMYSRKGDRQTARDVWGEVYRTAPDERTRRIAYNHYFDLTQDVDLESLRNAIAIYARSWGHHPASLERLVSDGFLRGLPRNLDDQEYRYDPRSGEVFSPETFKLRRRESP